MTAYLEVSPFPRAFTALILLPLKQVSVISKENTGPFDFDKEGVDCTYSTTFL